MKTMSSMTLGVFWLFFGNLIHVTLKWLIHAMSFEYL